MSRSVTAGVVGGAAGLAAAGVVAVGAAVARRRRAAAAARRFGKLAIDRSGEVVADDGIGLYYEQVGPADAPLTVVFVHGFALALGSFHFQRVALAEHFGDRIRMIFYDQRGHGRSDRGDPEQATVDQLGRDLHTVLAMLAPAGPLVLVGHSMGGMTIMALADAHPELFGPPRVGAVALLSTSAGEMASVTLGLPALLTKLKGTLLPLLLRGARRQANLIERGRAMGTDIAWVITRRLSFGAADIDPATVEYLNTMIAGTRIETVADFYPALVNHDKLAALPTLARANLLVICGDKDLLTPVEHSRLIAAALPDAELIVVPNGGHVALMGHPEVFDAALRRLIDAALADALSTGAERNRRRATR